LSYRRSESTPIEVKPRRETASVAAPVIPRRKPLTARVGLFGVGHHTYWGQFEGLREEMIQKMAALEAKLAKDALAVDAAKGLLEEICGLLKAIDELRTAESVDIAEFRRRELMGRIEDARRWQRFVDSVTAKH